MQILFCGAYDSNQNMLLPSTNVNVVYRKLKDKDTLSIPCSILLLVSKDIDAVCACRIFTHILQTENIEYQLKPVDGYDDIVSAVSELADCGSGAKYIFMINCGGSINIENLNNGKSDILYFIFDSHRPFHQNNEKCPFVYIFDDPGLEGENISSATHEDLDESARPIKRARTQTSQSTPRVYGPPAAHYLYSMSKQANKDTNDILWLAIVSLTYYFVSEKISRDDYGRLVGIYRQEVDDKNDSSKSLCEADDGTVVSTAGNGQIEGIDEFRLMLYRHWNIHDALIYSNYVAARLGTWKKTEGFQKLKEFLANIGISQQQSREAFTFMSLPLKRDLKQKLSSHNDFFSHDELQYASFQRNIGFQVKVSAADVVYSCGALLHCEPPITDDGESFYAAYDSLMGSKCSSNTKAGLEKSKEIQQAVVDLGRNVIESNLITNVGPFR